MVDTLLSPTIDIKAIRGLWRETAESPFTWRKCANQAGAVVGESGGFYVETDGFPRRAYMKPAREMPDDLQHCRAAREKIASDLAHDLGLPVPPACLSKYELRPVVVSLVMYPRQWPWKIVNENQPKPGPLAAALAKAFAECSAMYVFDTWVDQDDHGDHPHNIIWGYDPFHISDSEIIFLDYANSLGYNGNWFNDGWSAMEKAAFPTKICDNLNADRLSKCIEDIENIPEKQIHEIISRIPNSYLPVEQKSTIFEGLTGRRKQLRTTFSDLLPTSQG